MQKKIGLYAALLLLGLLLGLPHLSGSFWLDEAAQALEVTRPWHQQLQIVDDFQPPLLHLLLHAAQYFSHAEWWLRLVGALIPAALTVVLTYLVGQRWFSHKTGLLAALLLATNSLHIFFSQELRPYALPALFGVASWYLLVRLFEGTAKTQRILALGFIASTTAGLYSSYVYPFVPLSQGLWVLWIAYNSRSWQPVRTLGLAASAVVLLYLPWLPFFAEQFAAGQTLRTALPNWEFVVSTPQLKALPLIFGKFLYGVVSLDLTWQFAIAPLFVVLASAYLLRRHAKMPALHALGFWLVVSLALGWIVSFWVPVLQPKRVLFALPAFYLLVSFAITRGFLGSGDASDATLPGTSPRARKLTPKLLAASLCAVLFALNLWGMGQYYTNPQYQREDWRSLLGQIQREYPATTPTDESSENSAPANQTSALIFAFPEPFAPVRWYLPKAYPTYTTGVLYTGAISNQQLTQQLQPAFKHNTLLVFDYLRDLSDPDDALLSVIESQGYIFDHTIDYPNIGFVRVYTK